ncbi:MAG TPA: ADP-glyceromanno-heptose 6-epimerase [Bacteroidia bacterium]|nr:ADP-glyceromanno-heptose 6-epimerase [Bacteroidia bacterium]
MKVITGAAGFIGSCLVSKLNEEGAEDIILVDDFSREDKNRNLEGKIFLKKIHRDDFPKWMQEHGGKLDAVFHIGARTDTTEFDKSVFDRLNLNYSKAIWELCCRFDIPLVYASSAATYGLGEFGYKDDHAVVEKLKPLNPYGESKNDFDRWVLKQKHHPPHWYGLKFFNVYGPNEYHKGRMASVIFHAFGQISETGAMRLFRSHNAKYKDGGQLRDFVYVKDVTEVIDFLADQYPESGIYNLGTGKARTFLDLARSTFSAMGREERTTFIDTPEDIRDKYQYFTEADMSKLKKAGYKNEFASLEDGVRDYVQNYLAGHNYL